MDLDALLAGIVAPLVMANLVTLAPERSGLALLSGALWAWHLSTVLPAHSSES